MPDALSTEQKAYITQELISGKSQCQIARDLGVYPSTVNRIAHRDDIAKQIKDAQAELISTALRNAVKNQAAKIAMSTKILDKVDNNGETHPLDKTVLELADRAEANLLAATGIGPSHATSVQINNILVDNRVQLSPVVQGLLADRLGSVIQEPIDADFED